MKGSLWYNDRIEYNIYNYIYNYITNWKHNDLRTQGHGFT
jgi:hypothetical protein